MKRLALILALAFAAVFSAAAAKQHNLIVELVSDNLRCHGRNNLKLEDLDDILENSGPFHNVIVIADGNSTPAMALGVKAHIESDASSTQVVFVTPQQLTGGERNPDYWPKWTSFEISQRFQPLTYRQFSSNSKSEKGGKTVVLNARDAFSSYRLSYGGDDIGVASVVDILPAGDFLRVKVSPDVNMTSLLTFDHELRQWFKQYGRELDVTYFTTDTKVSNASAFEIKLQDKAQFEIPTLVFNYLDQTSYKSAPLYYWNSSEGYLDISKYADRTGWEYYDPAFKGSVLLSFTISIDGSIQDVVVNESKSAEVRDYLLDNMLHWQNSTWVPARDNAGNPVNMRVEKVRIAITRKPE